MTTLMTYAGPVEPHAPVTRTGGVPLVPAGFAWPQCAECDGPMQFQAHLLLDDLGSPSDDRGVLSVFMCQNDPGGCGEWEPDSGANRALVLPREGLTPATVPADGETLLGAVSGVDYVVTGGSYYDARMTWTKANGRSHRDALGMLGGAPSWLQADETPSCPSCDRPMGFVAQLEEGHDHRTAANYGGGGCAYAFACEPCRQGTFLWQC